MSKLNFIQETAFNIDWPVIKAGFQKIPPSAAKHVAARFWIERVKLYRRDEFVRNPPAVRGREAYNAT